MKIFSDTIAAKGNIKILTTILALMSLYSCATYKPEYGKATGPVPVNDSVKTGKPAHRFYLIGDAGYANQPHTQAMLSIVSDKLDKEGKNATLLYLGDNIYPEGMPPDNGSQERKDGEASLASQMKLSKLFPGQTLMIPGNHDWYNGYEGLRQEEKFINKYTGKKSFLPAKGCAIDDIKISDNITLITIDSQWYIEDWDNYPDINDNCDIKTREQLFTEFEDLLNKNQGKTIIVAVHHPLMSNGSHGGQFSLKKQLYPLPYNIPMPILGSLVNLARKASGYSTQDIQSRVYTSFSNRIKTLIQDKDNVIVVSGHDHNLQYIRHDNINQIISGAGSKVEAARVTYPEDFSYGGTGYAILDINDDGTAKVFYYKVKDGKEEQLFEKKLLEKPEVVLKDYPDTFPATVSASVYTPEMTDKSGFHRFLFGKHYRKYYSMPIEARSVRLDTLYGGLVPKKTGGGHQTNSLRLEAKDGKEYAMRAIKKSATRFLQAVAFKQRYVGDELENTFAESFLLDFYTTSHPYTPFIAGRLADNVGVSHTNPELFYIPKQNALGKYNDDFGDELYMIEEQAGKEQKDLESFGKPDDIIGTDDMLKNLHKDRKYSVDEKAYINARLFDMLIGDWDRHSDQWKWGEYKKDGKVTYRPIPKDRDQAFSKYDGALLSILMNIPALRHMQTFKDDIRNVKWLNREPYPLDLALITTASEKDWLEEAAYIREHLTDANIDDAFANLPKEMQDETIEDLKSKLKARKGHLDEYALDYRDVLLKTVLIVGTDKKERFTITRLPEGETRVEISGIKEGESPFFSQTFNRKKTKEIWIYGLDDDDVFEVKGNPENPILLRLLGGQNHDTYRIENGKKVKVYDFKSKKNTFEADARTAMILTDDYETNSYDPEKPKYNVVAGYPAIGYNPDDGVKVGASVTYTVNSFNRRPFSRSHTVRGNYYFATDGFELKYTGKFMNAAARWNIGMDVAFTSPNFSINYFGMGNETTNPDDQLGMDYNRVKLQKFSAAPSFFKESRNGSLTQFGAIFETIEVDGTFNRYVNQPGVLKPYLFEHRQYAGVDGKYSFQNYDNASLPALGMFFYLAAGWKTSIDDTKRNFPHAEGAVGIIHKITPDENLVFATTVKGKANFSNGFEFYQAATLGGDNDLRGYRRERFTGKRSVYQSTDIRLTLGRVKTSFIPMKYGIFGGYDYGRIWVSDDTSNKWHQSVGGGAWLNGLDVITAKVFYFYGTDGGRVAFGLSFGI
ncbi:metallophosphoesterase [Flavobacterium album]|uniref:Metallophosphoesterase n=1 Tax=Flavobacterium album TaxID=2175091 RepID=A0A2S1QXQ3_9FLAO|nr:metallophosphoesterase [Flavobacterium album]AWH85178.1 metallophosphoesterase [Flavobacterium album]